MTASPSGVYAAPADVPALKAVFAGGDARWITLDLSNVRDKRGLLTALAAGLGFPPHFGHNWDALADSLQDLSWLPASRIALELRHAQRLAHEAGGDLCQALDIFRDAVNYWASHRKTLLVLVEGAGGLPALPT